MGHRPERVIYKKDDKEINDLKNQLKEEKEQNNNFVHEMFNHFEKSQEIRNREHNELINNLIEIQEKNNAKSEQLLLLLKQSDEKHQKEIMELMKQNEENFVLFNSQKSYELEKYKNICEDNEQKMQILEEQLIKTKEENDRKYIEQELKFQEDLLNAKDEIERKEIEKKQEEAKQKKN